MNGNEMETKAKNLIAPEVTIREAMRRMTELAQGLMPVVAPDGKLIGVITDGDVRRAIIGHVGLDAPVIEITNQNPVTVLESVGREEIKRLMEATQKSLLPIVDDEGRFVRVENITHLVGIEPLDNHAVIIAGGEGRRLRPYTATVPKPMLRVGTKPLIESIVEGVAEEGIGNIVLLLHYLPEAFREYFSGRRFNGREIELVVEPAPQGTAGGLRLIEDRLTRPFLVLNGDTLIAAAWRSMLEAHEAQHNLITIGASQYTVQVPYGVLEIEGDQVVAVSEKPRATWKTVCSAYCLSPEVLSFFPKEDIVDMPMVIDAALARGGRIGYFPIRDFLRIEDAMASHRGIWES